MSPSFQFSYHKTTKWINVYVFISMYFSCFLLFRFHVLIMWRPCQNCCTLQDPFKLPTFNQVSLRLNGRLRQVYVCVCLYVNVCVCLRACVCSVCQWVKIKGKPAMSAVDFCTVERFIGKLCRLANFFPNFSDESLWNFYFTLISIAVITYIKCLLIKILALKACISWKTNTFQMFHENMNFHFFQNWNNSTLPRETIWEN